MRNKSQDCFQRAKKYGNGLGSRIFRPIGFERTEEYRTDSHSFVEAKGARSSQHWGAQLLLFGKTLVCIAGLFAMEPVLWAQQVECASATDVTGDGLANVVDVQCLILAVFGELLGEIPSPECIAQSGDVDCDSSVTVTDVNVATQLALGAPLPPGVDNDGDGCADACVGQDDPPGNCGTDVLCVVSSVPGQTAGCFFKVAAQSATALKATSLQFEISYDPQKISLINFFDDVCFPGGACFNLPLAGKNSFPLSTGHSMTTYPVNPSDWNGYVGGVILKTSPKELNSAYFADDGDIVGDPVIFEIRFGGVQEDVSSVCVTVGYVASYFTTLDTEVLDTGVVMTLDNY